jgi:hypothetical protein
MRGTATAARVGIGTDAKQRHGQMGQLIDTELVVFRELDFRAKPQWIGLELG